MPDSGGVVVAPVLADDGERAGRSDSEAPSGFGSDADFDGSGRCDGHGSNFGTGGNPAGFAAAGAISDDADDLGSDATRVRVVELDAAATSSVAHTAAAAGADN